MAPSHDKRHIRLNKWRCNVLGLIVGVSSTLIVYKYTQYSAARLYGPRI